MLRNTQSLAINLIRGLYETAEGRPMQWRSLDDFNLPQTAEVVRYATTRGWMVTCGEREQGLPYRCRLASDRIAVGSRRVSTGSALRHHTSQRPKDLANGAEAIGYATEGTNHVAR